MSKKALLQAMTTAMALAKTNEGPIRYEKDPDDGSFWGDPLNLNGRCKRFSSMPEPARQKLLKKNRKKAKAGRKSSLKNRRKK